MAIRANHRSALSQSAADEQLAVMRIIELCERQRSIVTHSGINDALSKLIRLLHDQAPPEHCTELLLDACRETPENRDIHEASLLLAALCGRNEYVALYESSASELHLDVQPDTARLVRRLVAQRSRNAAASQAPLSLTLFAVPRAFAGPYDRLQRNAIASWLALKPRPDILLLGDDPGVAEFARENNLRHVAAVERNHRGTPRIDSLFRLAHEHAPSRYLMYINCDVILLNDFMRTISMLGQTLEEAGIEQFLLSSQRRELDLEEDIDFSDSGAEQQLRMQLMRTGVTEHKAAVELMLFPRGAFTRIPPFAVGRIEWDGWMVWDAHRRNMAIIDATPSFDCIHQCHDYGYTKGGWRSTWKSEEVIRNRIHSRMRQMAFGEAATHALAPRGLLAGRMPQYIRMDRLVSRRVRRGLAEMANRRYAAAIDYLDDAANRCVGFSIPDLQFNRAVCLFKLRRFAEAYQAADLELRNSPGHAGAMRLKPALGKAVAQFGPGEKSDSDPRLETITEHLRTINRLEEHGDRLQAAEWARALAVQYPDIRELETLYNALAAGAAS